MPPGGRCSTRWPPGSAGAFAFDWQDFGWGCEYYARTGRMMAEDGLNQLQAFDAIYFGAVGWPGVPDHVSLWGLRLAICQGFDQWANIRRVTQDYPDVETESVLVDAMSAKFVLHPEDLSVVVASNLHADILSDLGSALAGSLGLAASANLNPERRFPSMFEPVHGSAPDIAGQGLANPIGAVGSAALMLEHLGLPDQAARLHAAIETTTGAGLTRDVGGTASTQDVTKALIDALNA